MAYVLQAEVEAEIPAPILREALDDDGDGQADDGKLDQVIANASAAVDGLIGGRYSVPIAEPAPAVVKRAAFVFVCETIYRRRSVPDEQNPFKAEGDGWRARLKRIGKGEEALDASVEKVLAADYGGASAVAGRS